jgi:hypothetical protein
LGFDLDDEVTEAAFFLEGSLGAMEDDADNTEAKVEVGGSCSDVEETVSSSDVNMVSLHLATDCEMRVELSTSLSTSIRSSLRPTDAPPPLPSTSSSTSASRSEGAQVATEKA